VAEPFDISGFTLQELADVERVTGVPLDRFAQAPSRALMVGALVWIRRRRDQPDLTLADVMGETMADTLPELSGESLDPTPPEAPPVT